MGEHLYKLTLGAVKGLFDVIGVNIDPSYIAGAVVIVCLIFWFYYTLVVVERNKANNSDKGKQDKSKKES